MQANNSRRHGGVDANNVGFARSNRQHALAATANEDRWTRCLNWFRSSVVVGDCVVIARKRKGTFGHCAFNDLEPFHETIDANFGRVVRDAHLFVVADHPARANTEFKSSIGQHVHGR